MASSYTLNYAKNPSLPRLAWCAEVDPSAGRVDVNCGEAVECHEQFFVEGAWDGAFAAGDFADALLFMGSGARLTPDGVRFSTASHTMETLFHTRSGRRLLVSNSLAFLLARSGLELDPRFPHYLSILASSRFGIERYTRAIPTASGAGLSQFLYGSLDVGRDGSLVPRRRREPADFTDFEDYKRFLVSGLSALWANARSPERGVRYGLITTVSSGYDSPACAALAREIGCDEALTFRAATTGEDDSGAPIARRLGMRVHEFSREESYANARAIVEFLACTDGDAHFAACEQVLAGKLCLTGYSGDAIWGKQFKPPWGYTTNVPLVRAEAGGAGLQEFHLRVGFIHVPIGMIALSRDRSIWQITHSVDMAPWTLGTAYDRPIPRRLAEEAGIPRELFGRSKKVTVTTFDPASPLLAQTGLAADFQSYLAQYGRNRRMGRAVHNSLVSALRVVRRGARLLDKNSLLPQSLRAPTYVAPPVPIRFLYPLTRKSYLVPWAVGKLREQYRSALAQS